MVWLQFRMANPRQYCAPLLKTLNHRPGTQKRAISYHTGESADQLGKQQAEKHSAAIHSFSTMEPPLSDYHKLAKTNPLVYTGAPKLNKPPSSASNPKAPKAIRLVIPTDIEAAISTEPSTSRVLEEPDAALRRARPGTKPRQVAGPDQPGQPAADGLQTGARVDVGDVEVKGVAAADGGKVEEDGEVGKGRAGGEAGMGS